jgi:hypothetical protein
MNPFELIAEFDFALEMAKRKYPDIDYAVASRATSGWNESEIQIRDRYNNEICSFGSSDFLHYMSRVGRSRPSRRPMATAGASAQSRSSDVAPIAAKNARSMVGIIKGCSYFFAAIVIIAGLVFAIRVGSAQGLLGLLVFVSTFVSAFIGHWIVKLTCIGLEVLADISEDLRAIRIAQSADQ